MENRKQYVCFNGTDSGFLPITCGVPQGSILGPTLFLLYVNYLCNVSTRLTSILFADDTSCFIEGTDLADMCVQLSSEMNKLSTWFKTNRLSLNVSKTNCMIFGRPDKPEHHRVYIDNIIVTNFLVYLLTLNYHGLIMYRTFVTKCRRICRCCEIWGNTYKTRIQPLYIIQKRAIRICNHLEYRSHSKPAFFNLKTLTIATWFNSNPWY